MKKNNWKKSKRGFTLIELIVAVGVYVFIMVAVTGIFSRSFLAYKRNKVIQKDMEAAQQAMNFVAKTLRTSMIMPGSDSDTILAYDFSRAADECIQLEFSGNAIRYSTLAPSNENPPTCGNGYGNLRYLTDTSLVTIQRVNLYYFSTNSNDMGKATISIGVCPPGGCVADNDAVQIQSTVSLRDYDNANL